MAAQDFSSDSKVLACLNFIKYRCVCLSALFYFYAIFMGRLSSCVNLSKQRFIQDNPVLGSISSLVGIIYGVSQVHILYLISNINYTSDAICVKKFCFYIFTAIVWFKQPIRDQVRQQARKPSKPPKPEWPVMQAGQRVNYADIK